MSGQIPKYGKHFRITNREYDPVMASRRYTLKTDARYYIQSDKRSKSWNVYGMFGLICPNLPTLTEAMAHLLAIYEPEPSDVAISELAHVARELLTRLVQIDPDLPGSISQAIANKIEYYSN